MGTKPTDPKNIADTVITEQELSDIWREIFSFIGDDPNREGLVETPGRILKSWKELFKGYGVEVQQFFKTFDKKDYNGEITLEDIQFFSTCEHHFLPFFGTITISYVPKNKVIGLSKLARIVEVYARRLQIQENLTCQIAQAMKDYLDVVSVRVVCKAKHFCVCSRGVSQSETFMTTIKEL